MLQIEYILYDSVGKKRGWINFAEDTEHIYTTSKLRSGHVT